MLLHRHKRAFLITGIAICIVAIILTLDQTAGPNIFARGLSSVVQPIQRSMSASIAWVQGQFSAAAGSQGLVHENRALRDEISLLQIENYRLQRADYENDRLSALLNMSQRYAQLPIMGARIIGQNPNNAHSRFFIDRGANDDVERNMAVLGDGGLLGVVRQVNPTRSQFFSIIDGDFSAAVMSERTEDIGTVRGDMRLMQQGLMRMDHINATAQIMPGDVIITSPHSSIFPPGLLVGTVVSIHSNPDGLTRHAIIEPAANVDNLEMVLVVTQVFGENIIHDGHMFIYEE